MKLEVNGIRFSKEELKSIRLSDIHIHTISNAHLFYIPQVDSKSYFLILRAGDYIDQDFLDQYSQKGVDSFYALEIATQSEVQNFKSLFSEVQNGYDEKQRQIAAQKINYQFAKSFWTESHISFLAFAKACYDQFYRLPNSVIETYKNTSCILYSRALTSASLSVVTCYIHRIVDPLFVQDLYNLVFTLDYGLIASEEFSYSIAQACEVERNNPGDGLKFLKAAKRPVHEENLFTLHPLVSANFVEEHKDCFNYPEVINIIRYHHEKSDGSGFPAGINYSAMSKLETFQIFCDYLIPFAEHIYHKGDGHKLIKENFEIIKKSGNMLSLPVENIIAKWDTAMRWVIEKEHQKESVA